jgi:hypothetical protein
MHAGALFQDPCLGPFSFVTWQAHLSCPPPPGFLAYGSSLPSGVGLHACMCLHPFLGQVPAVPVPVPTQASYLEHGLGVLEGRALECVQMGLALLQCQLHVLIVFLAASFWQTSNGLHNVVLCRLEDLPVLLELFQHCCKVGLVVEEVLKLGPALQGI